MLAGLPLTVTEELDPGAVHEQVERPIGAPIWDLNGQRLLPSAKRRVIRYLPIQPRHLEQAVHHPGRLAERQLEQNLDRQAELDRCVRIKSGGRPGRPSCGASQVTSLSTQINSDLALS